MAELSTESTCLAVSSSSSAHHGNWWDLHSASWSPSVHGHSPWSSLNNPDSNSPTCEEDISMSTTSFTNGSNHSGVTVDSSRRFGESSEAIGETASDDHPWSHVVLNGGGGNHGGMFQLSPAAAAGDACHDDNWGFSGGLYDGKARHFFNGSIDGGATRNENEGGSERNICDLISHLDPQTPRHDPDLFSYSGGGPEWIDRGNHGGLLWRLPPSDASYGAHGSCYYGDSSTNGRNSFDAMSFGGGRSSETLKPSCPKSLNLSMGWKKQGLCGRRQIINDEGKKRRSNNSNSSNNNNNNQEAIRKKQKHESAVVSTKMQAPKVKLGDKISALQQIVSPFGKTDTASVLLEAIGYIRFLQEQVQLLSNPYMKIMPCKDPWGALDWKEKGDAKFDLQGRGLCLVPTSCAPRISCCENGVGSDYWTPTYRGCMYR